MCPECGREHEAVYGTEEGFSCSKCGFFFGKELNEAMWTDKEVDAVYCNSCDRELTCTSENFNMLSSNIKEVLCPICNDSDVKNYFLKHSVAILYRGKWIPTPEFLHKKSTNGLLPVKSLRDAITLHVLNYKGKVDESSFRSVSPEDSKILWKHGEAIGYLTANLSRRIPCLRQIYVRPEYRRRGHATMMIEDFLAKNKGKILVESPNEASFKMLQKMGLATIDDEGNIQSNRIDFIVEM